MAFTFRDSYNLDMNQKRRDSKGFQAAHDLAAKRTTNIIYQQMDQAKANSVAAQRDLEVIQTRLALTPNDPGLQAALAAQQDKLRRANDALQQAQIAAITQTLSDNARLNGQNKNLQPGIVLAKFLAAKSFDPNVDPLQFTQAEIQKAKPTDYVGKITSQTQKLANAAERFRNIVEGRPNGTQAGRQAMDHFAMFDPKVCGLTALDNEGNILADDRFNLPFMFVTNIKDSKSSQYESISVHGRFEPYLIYTGAEPYTISMELGYMASQTGPNTDEGAIQEIKDRWLASQYPIYGKNQRSGVRAYGTPNKFLLNLLSRYVNIPVIVQNVSIDQEFGFDPNTWFAMGFKMNVEFKTQFRMSQVVSADDVVTKGLRTYSHRQF